jgi:hypothetical protein
MVAYVCELINAGRILQSDAQFLHGMLEGIAKAEAQAFSLLEQLGADPVRYAQNP